MARKAPPSREWGSTNKQRSSIGLSKDFDYCEKPKKS